MLRLTKGEDRITLALEEVGVEHMREFGDDLIDDIIVRRCCRDRGPAEPKLVASLRVHNMSASEAA